MGEPEPEQLPNPQARLRGGAARIRLRFWSPESGLRPTCYGASPTAVPAQQSGAGNGGAGKNDTTPTLSGGVGVTCYRQTGCAAARWGRFLHRDSPARGAQPRPPKQPGWGGLSCSARAGRLGITAGPLAARCTLRSVEARGMPPHAQPGTALGLLSHLEIPTVH